MTWHLLLLEDEASVREAFALRLRDQGYCVDGERHGEGRGGGHAARGV